MNVKFLSSGERKKLFEQLEKQFDFDSGVFKNTLLFETGKEKIRGFSGTMTRDELIELSKIANVEIIGLYLFRQEGELRLGFDGSQMLGSAIGKNTIDLDLEHLEAWLRGEDLEVDSEVGSGVYVLRHNNKIVGCGKSDGKKLVNFVPKERRIRRS